MKRRIRLTESNLNKLIKESVKQAINEISDEYKAYHAGKAWEAGGGDSTLKRFGHSILHPFKHRKYNRQAKKFGKSAVVDKPIQTMYTASGHTVSYRPDYNEKTGRFDINRNNSFKDERFAPSSIKRGHVPNTNSSLLSPDIDANELDGTVYRLNTYSNLGKGSVKAKRQNESKLHRIIKESVRRILREGFYGDDVKENRREGLESTIWYYWDLYQKGHDLSQPQLEQLRDATYTLTVFGEASRNEVEMGEEILNEYGIEL